MFRVLTDFSYRRTAIQALGFYLFYLLVAVLLAAIIGGVGAYVSGAQDFSAGYDIGARLGGPVACLFSLALAGAILVQKRLIGKPDYLLLALVGGVLALFTGGVGGLIIPAFFSTRASAEEPTRVEPAPDSGTGAQ